MLNKLFGTILGDSDNEDDQNVSDENAKRFKQHLSNDEYISLVAKPLGIAIEGDDINESFGHYNAYVGERTLVAFTDRRIVMRRPRAKGPEVYSVYYGDVSNVDFSEGITKKKVSIETVRRRYTITGGPDLRDAVAYIRQRMEEGNHNRQPVIVEGERDPMEQLAKAKELHDEGVLTQDEFEAQKEKLLNS